MVAVVLTGLLGTTAGSAVESAAALARVTRVETPVVPRFSLLLSMLLAERWRVARRCENKIY